jgi:hypothetical protein
MERNLKNRLTMLLPEDYQLKNKTPLIVTSISKRILCVLLLTPLI